MAEPSTTLAFCRNPVPILPATGGQSNADERPRLFRIGEANIAIRGSPDKVKLKSRGKTPNV